MRNMRVHSYKYVVFGTPRTSLHTRSDQLAELLMICILNNCNTLRHHNQLDLRGTCVFPMMKIVTISSSAYTNEPLGEDLCTGCVVVTEKSLKSDCEILTG